MYFSKYRLATEVDEKGLKDKNQKKEVEKENAIKEHPHCEFIRINPDGKDFDRYIEIGKIFNQINRSSEKPPKNH